MTEKMTAHLYLSSESFKYNGTDSDDAIKNKLVLFYDLVKTLVANKNENKLFVFHTAFLNSPIFSDGTTVMEIIQNQPESYNKYGKDAVTLLCSVFKHFNNEYTTSEDITEYLKWEDENNCHGVLVFDSRSSLPLSHQVISSVNGWLHFRRHYLAKYPKTSEFFANELMKYFPGIVFHSTLSQQISDVYKSHPFSIVRYLTAMEENLVSDFSNYGKDFIGFLDWFASKHGLDGASLEGTKDRDRFTFTFKDGTVAYCEPHLKMHCDDNQNSNQHCRIYFRKPQSKDDELVYVGCICEHL